MTGVQKRQRRRRVSETTNNETTICIVVDGVSCHGVESPPPNANARWQVSIRFDVGGGKLSTTAIDATATKRRSKLRRHDGLDDVRDVSDTFYKI